MITFNCIQNIKLFMVSGIPLSSVRQGSCARVESLPSHPPLQSRLRAMGIRPGAVVEVLRQAKPAGILHLASGILEFMMRHELAAQIEVSLV